MLHVSVIDDGVGITFKTVQQGDGSQGSGLGMKTMQERTDALGGTMRVLSEPMKGTVIEVVVPLKEVQA